MTSKTSKILTHVVYLSLLIVFFLFGLIKKIEADERAIEIQELTKQIGEKEEMIEAIRTSYESKIIDLKNSQK